MRKVESFQLVDLYVDAAVAVVDADDFLDTFAVADVTGYA
jgi:hypothetical protein